MADMGRTKAALCERIRQAAVVRRRCRMPSGLLLLVGRNECGYQLLATRVRWNDSSEAHRRYNGAMIRSACYLTYARSYGQPRARSPDVIQPLQRDGQSSEQDGMPQSPSCIRKRILQNRSQLLIGFRCVGQVTVA